MQIKTRMCPCGLDRLIVNMAHCIIRQRIMNPPCQGVVHLSPLMVERENLSHGGWMLNMYRLPSGDSSHTAQVNCLLSVCVCSISTSLQHCMEPIGHYKICPKKDQISNEVKAWPATLEKHKSHTVRYVTRQPLKPKLGSTSPYLQKFLLGENCRSLNFRRRIIISHTLVFDVDKWSLTYISMFILNKTHCV